MQIILVKRTKVSPFISWQNPLILKNAPPPNLTMSMPYLLQAQLPLPYYYWPVILVLQQYADRMATV